MKNLLILLSLFISSNAKAYYGDGTVDQSSKFFAQNVYVDGSYIHFDVYNPSNQRFLYHHSERILFSLSTYCGLIGLFFAQMMLIGFFQDRKKEYPSRKKRYLIGQIILTVLSVIIALAFLHPINVEGLIFVLMTCVITLFAPIFSLIFIIKVIGKIFPKPQVQEV